ncbi:hypothetical protein GJ496_007685 [Pomphorhynchus laevis]|nr:hypothetical protein GJ496_007685 [Pomphorhynchus laevis]
MYFPHDGYDYNPYVPFCEPPCGGHIYSSVIHAPEPPPQHIVRRRRLPTPPPNIYQQTVVIRPPRQIVHDIVEQPICPQPIMRTNYVMAPRPPPQYQSNTVSVCPSGSHGNLAGGIMPYKYNRSPSISPISFRDSDTEFYP